MTNCLRTSLVLLSVAGLPSVARLDESSETDAREEAFQRIESLSGKRYLEGGQEAEWKRLVTRMVQRDPRDPRALYWQADWHDRHEQIDEATRIWHSMVDDPTRANSTFASRAAARLASLELAEGDAAGAVDWARKAVAWNPHNVEALQTLLDASLRLGGLEEMATTIAASARGSKPDELAIPAMYGELLVRLGRWDDVSRWLDEQERVAEREPIALHLRASLAEMRGRPQEAFALHFLASEMGPAQLPFVQRSYDIVGKLVNGANVSENDHSWPYLVWLASAPETAGQAIAGLKAFEPSTPAEKLVRQHLLARSHERLGQVDEATSAWNRALELRPNYVPALVALQNIHESQGNREQATKLGDQAHRIAPESRIVRQHDALGVELEAVPDGVRIHALAKESPFYQAGLRPGMVLTELDREPLGELEPSRRFQVVRTFGGGRFRALDTKGKPITGEIDYLFPEYQPPR
ncbi:Tetratricopeptide repeat protein [Planctomycetes bacterium Pan216]|uniref:Tetratricopeptide repeat protein n=1 Tax=Kolteria novifilia TaxID=2527975 RepID=A0A518B9I1_9BACT|nr:Tetratricopeptide repeat protein [Planctomycetes bacterium Pan216]